MGSEDEDTRTGWLRRGSGGRAPERTDEAVARERPSLLANRYALGEELGAGGMGVVYQAYDRQLDREVAIKLLHPRAATTHARRLLREAQTLAKLSHPNLVPVFDVGWAGDELFVAMELVRGHSLARVVAAREVAWRERLRLVIEAGRGLEHAHRRGLVHRDFKPANVLVGEDGRARVADFGLARPVRVTAERNGSAQSREDPGDAIVTKPGSNPGTPAYMPPETTHSGVFDERSDQFSFCVSAWEVLYGARPQRDPTTGAPLPIAPAASSVPRVVRRVLERGMALQPGDRFASMRELLRALESDRPRVRSRWIAASVAVVLVGGGAYAALDEPSPCDDVEREIDRAYDADTRAQIRANAEGWVPQLPELHDAIEAPLERYAARWTELRRETCVAHEIEHRHSDALFDRRMRCLEERRQALAGVADVLARAENSEPILSGPTAIAGLPDLDACTDDEALLAAGWQPQSSDETALVQELWVELGRVRALVHTGQLRAAMPEADALLQRTESLPSSPLRAKAQLQWALLRRQLTHATEAFDGLKRAAETAAAAKDDETLAEAWLELVAMLADDYDRAQEFETVASLVEGLIERLERPSHLRARLLDSRARMALSGGQPDRAVEHASTAVAVLEGADVDEPLLLATLNTTAGLALKAAGRFDEAAARFEAAIASSSSVLTPMHPRIGGDLMNLSLVQPPEQSEATLQRAAAIQRASFPDGHADLGLTLTNLGLAFLNRGAYPEAEATLHEALAMQRRVFPDGHVHTSHTLITLADTLNEVGRRREALAFGEEGLALRRALLPPDHPEVGSALRLLAAIHFDEGDIPRARERYEEALTAYERALPSDHPMIAGALNGIGECAVLEHDGTRALEVCTRALEIERKARGEDALHLVPHLSCIASAHDALGHPELAIPLLERALELWSNVDVGPLLPAQIRLQLATALHHAGRDRDRVVDLARSVLNVASSHPDSRGRLIAPAQRLLDAD